ncbi:hypothetical protein H0H93_003464 [Arthromyces matolae]|nr:hypothetical protein H0H93_003464 [Arthromyces matolae]
MTNGVASEDFSDSSCICKHESQSITPPPPKNPVNDENALSGPTESITVPWTITNKYYSALVHFRTQRIHGLSPHQVQNIPAVIFAWSKGEPFKHHIKRIVQDLSGFEPEVCLAVRLAQQASSPLSPVSHEDEDDNDDNEIDRFLSSHGFEFIDADKNARDDVDTADFENDPWSNEEMPGIERVVDALSTIMWPSMKSTTKSKAQDKSPLVRERERVLLDWAYSSQDSNLSAVIDVDRVHSEVENSKKTRALQREMEDLTRWLEEEKPFRDDPWNGHVNHGAMSTSPTSMEFVNGQKEKFGFDDDFTVFVSAPLEDPTDISGRSTPDADALTHYDDQSLSGLHVGSLYRALGSVSDFGGSEEGKDVNEDSIDDDLPSKEEIVATSSRLFGTKTLAWTQAPGANTQGNPSDSTPSVMMGADTFADVDVDAFGIQNGDADGDGSYDMEAFDLSKVVGALQEMKAEIATMKDEGERRRAAARVALGLVYGLEADSE